MFLPQTRPLQRAKEPKITQDANNKGTLYKTHERVKTLNILPIMSGKLERSHLFQQTNTNLVKRMKASFSRLLHDHTRLWGNQRQKVGISGCGGPASPAPPLRHQFATARTPPN